MFTFCTLFVAMNRGALMLFADDETGKSTAIAFDGLHAFDDAIGGRKIMVGRLGPLSVVVKFGVVWIPFWQILMTVVGVGAVSWVVHLEFFPPFDATSFFIPRAYNSCLFWPMLSLKVYTLVAVEDNTVRRSGFPRYRRWEQFRQIRRHIDAT